MDRHLKRGELGAKVAGSAMINPQNGALLFSIVPNPSRLLFEVAALAAAVFVRARHGQVSVPV
jgi:hypothetical protein